MKKTALLKYSILATALLIPSYLLAEPAVTTDAIQAEETPTTHTLNEGNNGATQPASIEDTIKVTLASTPSTGFTWVYELSTKDANGLPATDGLTFQSQDAVSAERPGESGKEIFVFNVTGSGLTTLTFDLKRPWEENKSPMKEVSFTVDVN